MNTSTKKLIEIDKKKKLVNTLKLELQEFENIDIIIAIEKFIFEVESIEI